MADPRCLAVRIWKVKMILRLIGALTITALATFADVLIGQAQGQRPTAAPSGADRWPENEPAGMTPILVVDGSDRNWPGFQQGGRWQDPERIRVVEDPESKYGFAIEKRFFIGDTDGWNGIAYRNNWGLYRQQYVRMVFKFSPNFQFHAGNQKLYYWGGGNRPGESPVMFAMFVYNRQRIEFRNNGTAGGAVKDRGSYRSDQRVERGRYHTLEVLQVANTPGNADGSIRVWLDGVEITDWRLNGKRVSTENRNWIGVDEVPDGDTRLTGMQCCLYWGGQGNTKRLNDWIRFAELYISGRN